MVSGPGEPDVRDVRDARLEDPDDPDGGSAARRLARFFGLTLRQAHEDSILLTASALAFVTILSLIPLLAAFSFVGARVFNQYQQRSLEVFVQILPYSEKTVTDKLGEFLEQAQALHGFGLIAFFVTTLLAFATIEETINKIWNVARRRPFKVRLLSFTLLLFWGPLLVGATFSSLFVLRQSPGFRRLIEESVLLGILPFAATLVGLTMLYWLVPYTTVCFRNALAGGILAAILLELLRQGFGFYVDLFHGVNAVYGSFAFVLLFVLSIELTWAIVLYGSEVAYTAQYFPLLARGSHRHPPLQASWVGLAALTLVAGRFARGEPILSQEGLAARLHLSAGELERILNPLLSHNLLRRTEAGEPGYLLATDPHHLPLEKVFQAYDHRARRAVQSIGGDLRKRLESLVGTLAGARAETLARVTVADLLEAGEATQVLMPGGPAGR